jgi:type IV pilus assembly protein PilW
MNSRDTSMPRTTCAGAAGFTIVELMIAMVLGLMITLVVSQVFLSSKETYNTVEELSRLQENARYGLSQLARVGRMTGYISNPLNIPSQGTIFPTTARMVDGADGASGAPDSVTFRFQGSGSPTADNSVIDCAGNAIAADSLAVNSYYIATGANGRNSLFCDNTGTVGPATTGALELVPNVETMQVLYGEDTDTNYTPDYYVARGAVVDADKVRSVRVAMVFSSNDFMASTLDTKTYSVLDVTYDPTDDRRLRRVYTTTITLRNRVQ